MSKYSDYYSEYVSSSDSEPFYDYNNPKAWEALKNSPTHAEYFKIIEDRKHKEELHENWEQMIHHDVEVQEIKEKIKEEYGMRIHLRENRVTFVYEPEFSNEEKLFKFKVVLRYSKIVGKWYFSLGYSFLPDIIPFKDIIKYNVFNPIGPSVLKIIQKIKQILDSYIKSYFYIFRFIDYAKKKYPDISFQVDQCYKSLKILLMDKIWPKNIKKISPIDVLILNLTLNEDLKVDTVDFEYIYENVSIPKKEKTIHMDLLSSKMNVLMEDSLYEAFISFMEE